jgi:polysaccharide export outer membrane protein
MRALKTSAPGIRWRFAGVLAVLSTLFLTKGVWAQDKRPLEDRFKPQQQIGGDSVPPPNVIVSSKEDYRIGPGDHIEIRVEDAPELLTRTRVSADGKILMNYLNYVPIQGKTTDEVAILVAEKLRGRYLKNPLVSVAVTQVNSRSFLIQGAVRRPGPFQIEGRPSLMRLINYAGGILENHGSRAFVFREIKALANAEGTQSNPASAPGATQGASDVGETTKYIMLTSNINALYKGRFDEDILLEPGDIVNIPPTDVFFVAGEVNAPGEFPLKDGTTLRQAIAMAQNWTPKAKPKNAVIFREGINGERKEISVDIAAVMNNKSPDVPLMANDIVIVPNSPVKSALLPILNAFGSGASFAVGGRVIR